MDAQDGGDRTASDEVEDLRHNLQEHEQQHLRLLADFENFRRRVAREREGAREEGRRDTLLHLLPALDTLERALAKLHPVVAWVATLPLRAAPIWFDAIVTRVTRWPSYSICLEAYKPRFERADKAAELREAPSSGRLPSEHAPFSRLRDGTTGR